MIRCYHCGTDNLDGSEYCDECGKKLNSASTTVSSSYIPPPPQLPSQMSGQNAPPPPPAFTREAGTPKPATPYTPPPPPVRSPSSGANPPARAVQNPTTTFNGPTGSLESGSERSPGGQAAVSENSIRAKLIIQRGGKIGKEFPIAGSESMIGRWDADGGIFPDIDLDQDDPEAKVSRRHARIQFLNNQFLIEDLGSTNGTFINRGPRLLPGNKQPLNNGDEIIVGKTFLKFILN